MDSGLQLLPFYLVGDESGSMEGTPIDEINKSLPELHAEIGANPAVADKTRFCLISFSDTADVLLPLTDLSALTTMPKFNAGGGTNYEAAFDLLRKTIDKDVTALKNAGNRVYRPAVFFLSDGQPNHDNWQASFKALTDPSWGPHPNVLAFGFGAAVEATIQQVGITRAFIADNTVGPAQALREFANSLIRSIVNSASSATANAMTLAMPDQVQGFTNITADQV